jgi:hypothetical protein
MRISFVPAAILGLAFALVPGSAAASCAEFPPLEAHLAQAEVVFVGTVSAVTDEQRTALIDVEEVWRETDLPAQVTVHGGLEDLAFTSVDRTFETGTRYLFAASLNEGRLEDNACSATQAWTDDLAELRPATVGTPQPTPADDDAPIAVPLPVLVTGLAVALVAGLSVIAFRSRT